MIRDSSASLLAYGLDDPSLPPSKVAVVDIGWSSTEISIYDVSGGLFFPLASVVSTDICGKIFVDLLADHCAKDFQRKSKLPCTESSKSMMRLKRECEDAMKILSTGVCVCVCVCMCVCALLLPNQSSFIHLFTCLSICISYCYIPHFTIFQHPSNRSYINVASSMLKI